MSFCAFDSEERDCAASVLSELHMGGWRRVAVSSVQVALHDCIQATIALQLGTLSKPGTISVTSSVLPGFQFAVDNASALYVLLQE